MAKSKLQTRLQECRDSFGVRVLRDGKEVYRNAEYRVAAEWARDTYGLSDPTLLEMYADYKRDRDR